MYDTSIPYDPLNKAVGWEKLSVTIQRNRDFHQCGLVTHDSGLKEVVITGGKHGTVQ